MPNVRINSSAVNVRTTKAYTSTEVIGSGSGGNSPGNPIGLLLALTYAVSTSGSSTMAIISTSDFRPAVRIK